MKRLISIFSCALMLVTVASCSWFKLDNQEGWDAKVQGKLLDTTTGEPVQSEHGNYIVVVEHGWDAQANQSWRIKNDGTYRNDLVFAGEYTMNTVSNANFMAEPQDFILKKGENTVNFNVTPFVTIKNAHVEYDAATKKIKATCTVKANFPADKINNIGAVVLCVYPDRFVKRSYNKCENDPEAIVTNLDPSVEQTVTLYVDTQLAANAEEFQYERAHYIRIAAIGAHYDIVPEHTEIRRVFNQEAFEAWGSPEQYRDYFWMDVEVTVPTAYAPDGKFNPSGAYNYSNVFKLEKGVVTEVTDW